MNILVTGGAGYIGSHTCISLIESGYSVTILDNFSNSNINTIDKIREISQGNVEYFHVDVTDSEAVEDIFKRREYEGIIHFAGFKSVNESMKDPLKYYHNNILSTIVLSKLCLKYSVNKFIFSSSATVYGENSVPFKETMDLLPTKNPYGESKKISERILKDTSDSNSNFSVTLLRYFNPIGAHRSGELGDSPKGIPNNLMPYITQVAKGKLKLLNVFGDDYPTNDGTGVRDYIHVMDLAEGHVKALESLEKDLNVYNLGTGNGTSVLELINTFEKVNKIEIPYRILDRRSGDIPSCFADVSKAKEELGWYPQRDIKMMCLDAWEYEKRR